MPAQPIYETVLVVKPQLSDQEVGGIVDKTRQLISGEGGSILNEDRWGRRKLAYQIKHCREGFYVYLKFNAPPSLVGRLEQHFRLQEPVLRTITVRQEIRKPLPPRKPKP